MGTLVRVILQEVDEGRSTKISVSVGMKFYKSVVIKGVIQRSAKTGMTSTYELYIKALRDVASGRRGAPKSEPDAVEQTAVHERQGFDLSDFVSRFFSLEIAVVFLLLTVLFLCIIWSNLSTRVKDMTTHIERLEVLLQTCM